MTITNTFATKVAVVGLGVAVALSAFAFAPVASAQTTAELQAQIQSLLATIAQLQAQMGSMSGSTSGGASTVFTRDLTIGSSGADVTALQNWLIGKGHSIPAGATGYFGAQTQAALAAWQAANGVSPAAGYFGPITRAKINAMGGAGSGSGAGTDDDDDDVSGDLEGGAGSLDDVDFVSGLNSEEVGEDEEDVEIIGLTIEADEGSDIEITAVQVDFDQNSATEDFEDVATEVTVWLDGEEFARVDSDEFTDDDDFSKTISLDNGAIIRAGEEADLTIAVSGASNIDSTDAGDTWDVAIASVRFEDADGASVTDSTTGDIGNENETGTVGASERSFTFDTFASAADIELKATLDNESPDSQTVNVDSTNDTDGVELMRFTLEAEGGEVTVKDLPITLTVTGSTDVDFVANTLYVEIDGEEFSETISTATLATASITFDNIDFVIGADETVDVVVKADLNDITAGDFDEGDTIKAEFTASNRNSGDYEDETGENLVAGDKTGTALGDEMALYDVGIMVTFVSSDESVNAIDSADNDSGTFQIKYRVESFDGSVVVADSTQATTDVSEAGIEETTISEDGGGVIYVLEKAGTATTVKQSSQVTFTTSGGASDASITNGVQLTEGEYSEFTLTVVRTNSTATDDNGLYRLLLDAIGWATTDADLMNVYDFDLEDYKTDPVNLD